MTSPRIDILLATWNGEAYLAEQIDSILTQTAENWRLIARDDGSTDNSVAILKDFAARHPDRISLLEDGDRGLGACGNFERLMTSSGAEYVMFCDQDDVWLPDKIEILMAAMRRLEREYGRETPLLVHSDLAVVGPDLEPLNPSFWAFQAIDSTFGDSINRLLVQNVVTGCASLCNRSLIEEALPIPGDAMMHDWWLALVAASFGRIAFVRDTTVQYRQHGENAVGAKQFDFWARLLKGFKAPGQAYKRTKAGIGLLERQAQEFLRRYGARLPDALRQEVSRFATLSSQGFIERRLTILRHRFFAKGRLYGFMLLVAV